jgi:hypothetical protein
MHFSLVVVLMMAMVMFVALVLFSCPSLLLLVVGFNFAR